MLLKRLLRKREIKHSHPIHSPLARIFTAFDLTLLGIGVIIGAGIFVLTGIAAATKAGPAVVLSYLFAGLAALFSALAYAELAASVGGTGSAYSYAYAGFGEFIAWLIGWNLLLEYTLAIATVSIGWAGYVNNFFQSMNMNLPVYLTANADNGGFINLLAIFIILLLGALQCIGIRESIRINAIIVFLKLATILLFIVIASLHINVQNWRPFMPFGWHGVLDGAALVFFSYIGFDALSTAVEETIEPQRNIPIGIITSLAICTALYIAVAGLLTSIVSYQTLNVASPVTYALLEIGYHLMASIISVGAIAGLTSVMLVMFYGLSRICLAMARDGLLPRFIGHIHPRTHTPLFAIITIAISVSALAGFAPIDRLAELVNIGTLTAFTFVCAGIIVLRKTHPKLYRPFKTPFSPYIPMLGIFLCGYLMFSLPLITWIRFVIWTLIGIVIYFGYGYRHSHLRGLEE